VKKIAERERTLTERERIGERAFYDAHAAQKKIKASCQIAMLTCQLPVS
jgi:hypothetical protein